MSSSSSSLSIVSLHGPIPRTASGMRAMLNPGGGGVASTPSGSAMRGRYCWYSGPEGQPARTYPMRCSHRRLCWICPERIQKLLTCRKSVFSAFMQGQSQSGWMMLPFGVTTVPAGGKAPVAWKNCHRFSVLNEPRVLFFGL